MTSVKKMEATSQKLLTIFIFYFLVVCFLFYVVSSLLWSFQ